MRRMNDFPLTRGHTTYLSEPARSHDERAGLFLVEAGIALAACVDSAAGFLRNWARPAPPALDVLARRRRLIQWAALLLRRKSELRSVGSAYLPVGDSRFRSRPLRGLVGGGLAFGVVAELRGVFASPLVEFVGDQASCFGDGQWPCEQEALSGPLAVLSG